jgi:hypothetical protein
MFAEPIVCANPTTFCSVRGMPHCIIMGQATDTAAAIALKTNMSVQSIDTRALVTELSKQGVNGLGGTALA